MGCGIVGLSRAELLPLRLSFVNPSRHHQTHTRLPVSSSLRRRLRLPHPVRRRAPTAGTVGLRNPASREPVRVRGNQVFGERSRATTGITTSSSDDEFLRNDNFFPDNLDTFFGNLTMGDNIDAAKYAILSVLFQFLGLVSVVDVIGLYYIDAICSSTLLVCMISLLVIFIVMIYQLLVRIISYGYLLIYSTIQKPDYRQINSSSVAAATRPPLFDGLHYKRWRTRAVLWFKNLGCSSAIDARPEGPLSAEEQERFEKVDAMFRAALFSILGDNIVDPYMAFEHGKDAWDALEAKFGVSDAGYWKEAARSEMDSILANGTWEITDRPYGCKLVGCKWVFKKKLRPDGTIEKYKARLVAKGYTQKEGEDFFDTYSPVARLTTI